MGDAPGGREWMAVPFMDKHYVVLMVAIEEDKRSSDGLIKCLISSIEQTSKNQ